MDENFKKTITKLKKILQEKNFSEYKKETLYKLINLFNDTNNNSFEKILLTNLEELKENYDIFIPQINSILSDFSIRYLKKTLTKEFSIYYYDTYIDVFLQDNCDVNNLKNEIKSPTKQIQLLYLNQRKTEIISMKDLDSKFKTLKPSEVKIRIITDPNSPLKIHV